MYQDGRTVADIQRETELPRSSVYWVLEKNDVPLRHATRSPRGLTPGEAAARAVDELAQGKQTVTEIVTHNSEQIRQFGDLLAQNQAEMLRALVEIQSAVLALSTRIDRLIDRLQ